MAWAIPVASAQAEPQVTDPTGDARWYEAGDQAGYAFSAACGTSQATQRACRDAPSTPELPTADQGGLPAPPVLDIVHARFDDVGGTLHVELAVASLDLEFTTGSGAGTESLTYWVCWGVEDAPCRDAVVLTVFRWNGSLGLDTWVVDGSLGPCAGVGCSFNVPLEVIPGTPGYLRWHVPRDVISVDTTLLRQPMAFTEHTLVSPSATIDYSLRNPELRERGWVPTAGFSGADSAGPGKDVPVSPAQPAPPALFVARQDDEEAPGESSTDRGDLELVETQLIETDRTLTISTTIARVDESPADHRFWLDVWTTAGGAVGVGYDVRGGVRTEYGENQDGRPLRKAAQLDIVPGEPGYVNVTLQRTDLGRPGPGDRINAMVVAVAAIDPAADPRVEGASLNVAWNTDGDFLWDPPIWRFELGEPRIDPSELEGLVLAEDPVDDVAVPMDWVVTGASTESFDITYLSAAGSAPGVTRIEIGVRDLTSVSVPKTYESIFYAVALQFEEAAYMVGYFDDGDQRREFFCAPDTAVLAAPRRTPTEAIWTKVEGLLSIARGRSGAAGGGGEGSIVFLVPDTCFGRTQPGDLHAELLSGGAYLVHPQRGVLAIDEASTGAPVVITAGRAVVAAPPFWQEPFGIGNFWDLTGIVTAAVVALVGAVALRRKQGALRRYLHEIDHVLREHAADARAREKALHSIQDRVKADLLKNRITESHFVIVERRLDQHLAKVRVQALGDVFGDIPHRLLLTLQDLLRDGAMDVEDWRLFRTQLQAEAHLSADSRASIERRVESWVREHRE